MSVRLQSRYAVLLATVLALGGCAVGTPTSVTTSMSSGGGSVAASPAVPSSTTSGPSLAAAPPSVARAAVAIEQDLIPFGESRKQETAEYSRRHYGTASWQLKPSMIVLHYTAGSSWTGARDTFASNARNVGELPGTCSHFVIDKEGTIHQIVPTSIRCRHTIGLNDRAIGIEMVQEGGTSPTWADQQILARPAQIGAALALVRKLQADFGIRTADVIGHATADDAPQFRDLQGWRNDHVDWQAADVAEFRRRL